MNFQVMNSLSAGNLPEMNEAVRLRSSTVCVHVSVCARVSERACARVCE